MLDKIYRVTTASNAEDNDFPGGTVAVYVGVTGDLRVDFWGEGVNIDITNLEAGMWHEMNIKKIHGDANTTVDDILVAY